MLGDIVSISENSVPPSALDTAKDLVTGTVTKVGQQSISIAIDNDIETVEDDLNEAQTYKIIKLSNDITHRRIKNALVGLKEANLGERGARLADVLFLEREPERVDSNIELNFFNKRLDDSQKEAVTFTFEQKDLAIIHGPPGTGWSFLPLYKCK